MFITLEKTFLKICMQQQQCRIARNTKILDHDRVDFKMPHLSKFIIEHKLIWIIRLIHKEPTWSKI